LLSLPTTATAQQKAELLVGWLGYSGGLISQVSGIRNNGRLPIKTAKIGCSFFRYSKQLRVGSVDIGGIDPNAVGYKTILIASSNSPNRAACRVVSVKSERESHKTDSDPNVRATGRSTAFDSTPQSQKSSALGLGNHTRIRQKQSRSGGSPRRISIWADRKMVKRFRAYFRWPSVSRGATVNPSIRQSDRRAVTRHLPTEPL
jgi:hypothetical protein